MSENSTPIQPPQINPYQTPTVEEMKPEPGGGFVPPSPRLVILCVAASLGWSLLVSLTVGEAAPWLGFRSTIAIIVNVPLAGLSAGLGVALFIQAVYHRQFTLLMPGHWRLIAAAVPLVGQAVWMLWAAVNRVVPMRDSHSLEFCVIQAITAVVAARFYFAVLRTTRETGIWRWYARMAAYYYLVLCPVGVFAFLVLDLRWGVFLYPIYAAVGALNLLSLAAVVLLGMGFFADYRQGIPRDKSHYVGVFWQALVETSQWSLRVAYLFI